MKWVLIWFVLSDFTATSGSIYFESEKLCEAAALGVKVELVLSPDLVSTRCYPVFGDS